MQDSLPPLPVPVNGINLAPPPPPPPPSIPTPNPLERELPTVSTDLVPLSYLIDRLVTQSYSDLSTLIETLPSHSDQQRKQLLVDYVLHTRRQFLKLLVLTRWSAESLRIQKSINIIGFLSNQNHQLDTSIQQLNQTVEGLKGARVRNYDLETSLNVLQKGTYEGLPSGIREAFQGHAKLGDDEVIDTMKECERVMRWRLKMGKEELPKLMADNYRIADGRVTFRIEGLWEASFVYSGTETQDSSASSNNDDEDNSTEVTPEDQSEWYLLGVRFLFSVMDERGGTWNPTPEGPLKQHLIDLCNAQLARRPFLPPPPPPSLPQQPPIDSQDPTTGDQDVEKEKVSELEAKYASELKEVRSKRKRDQPLQRGYTFLQRLALSYQLESIYSQAVQLIRSDWNACGLRVEINGERDQVNVKYWNDTEESRNPSKPIQPPSSSPTNQGGSLVFSVSPLPSSPPHDPSSTNTSLGVPTIPSRYLDDRTVISRRRKALESLLNRTRTPPISSTSSTSNSTLNRSEPVASSSSSAPNAAATTTTSPPDYPPTCLQITYHASTPNSTSSPSLDLDLDHGLEATSTRPTCLDLEKVLAKVTRQHARETVESIARELGIDRDPPSGRATATPGVGKVVCPVAVRARRIRHSAKEKGKARDGMDVEGPELGEEEEKITVDAEKVLEKDNGPEEEEKEEEEEEEVGVPHVFVPLVEPHAITIHVDSKSGRVEIRSASTSEGAEGGEQSGGTVGDNASGNGEGSRETRLRTASDRINASRFTNSDGQAWVKSLPEVIARIRATTILDEISTLFTLLSLPTLRRLPLPPRELSKFGPLPALALGRPTFLFVPLSSNSKASGLEGFYLSIVLMEEGVRMALVGTRECVDENSGSSWVEITEVGWLYRDSETGTEKGKAKGSSRVEDRGSNFGHQLSAATLRKCWNFCVHRILVYRLEQQLHSRQISYRSSSTSSLRLSIDLEPPPFLILDTRGLVKLPRSAGTNRTANLEDGTIVLRSAALRCQVDDETTSVRTTLHIRLHPSVSAASLPAPFSAITSTLADADDAPTTLPRNVYFNPSTKTFVFMTENDVLGSVERLLKAYAGVLKELQDAFETVEKSRLDGKGNGREKEEGERRGAS